jgi:hypothetical protein
MPPESAVVGTQIFGTKGAPVLPFSEFQKYKLQVGEGGTVLFLGLGEGSTVILAANGEPLRVDKGLKAGTWVH